MKTINTIGEFVCDQCGDKKTIDSERRKNGIQCGGFYPFGWLRVAANTPCAYSHECLQYRGTYDLCEKCGRVFVEYLTKVMKAK